MLKQGTLRREVWDHSAPAESREPQDLLLFLVPQVTVGVRPVNEGSEAVSHGRTQALID